MRNLLAFGPLLVVCSAFCAPCEPRFAQFLGQFERDRATQEAAIAYPLVIHEAVGQNCYPDCPLVERRYSRSEVASLLEPVFPLPAFRKEQGMSAERKLTRSTATVRIFIQDSDAYDRSFVFRSVQGCWRLVEVR